jgi:hypothetical protein
MRNENDITAEVKYCCIGFLTSGTQALAMDSSGHAVEVWNESVVIPTYEPYAPLRQPMFLDKRVYQGSSGKVYPLPFTDRISTNKSDRA